MDDFEVRANIFSFLDALDGADNVLLNITNKIVVAEQCCECFNNLALQLLVDFSF